MTAGLTLPEALIAVAVLGILSSLALPGAQESVRRQQVETASRQLSASLERARAQAEQTGQPCGLSLGSEGWQAPAGGSLPACLDEEGPGLSPGIGIGHEIRLRHTFPSVLRIASNGLVLDGGTAVLSLAGTSLQRCLVMAPPLGVVRQGRYQGAATSEPSSSACLPDPGL